MGLFSSKIKTVVSSSVYNLAGDIDLRPNVMQQAIISTALSGKGGMGDAIKNVARSGPHSTQRSFFRWAKTNIPDWMPTAQIEGMRSVDTATVYAGIKADIPLTANQVLRVFKAVIDGPDLSYWAEDWVRVHRPDLSEDAWTVGYDKATDSVIINLADEDNLSFPASDDLLWGMESASNKLLFAYYTIVTLDPETSAIVSETTGDMYVYRMNTGNVALDSLDDAPIDMSEFFPTLPLRVNNVSIRDTEFEETYELVEKAYKRLANRDIEDLMDAIEDNENLDDIDYCYLVHGVSLNTPEKTGKEYLYKFFRTLIQNQTDFDFSITDYLKNQITAASSQLEVDVWAKWNTDDTPLAPLYGTIDTAFQAIYNVLGQNSLNIVSESEGKIDYRISWKSMVETQHVGNCQNGEAKQGDFFIVTGSPLEDGTNTTLEETICLYYQHSALAYSKITIVGLEHKNLVYAGVSVTITGSEALEDEEESGFLVPLHYPTLASMGGMKGSQLATANTYLVFNCYVQKKIKWYQRGIFKVLLFAVTIGLTIIFPPAGGLANASGILGVNAAVGVALGATTLATAAIVGAVVNAIAAVIVANIISAAAIELLGEKIGAIVSAIVGVIVFTPGVFDAKSFSIDWTKLMRAENLMKLTDATLRGVSAAINADTAGIYEDIVGLDEEYESMFTELSDKADDVLGMTNVQFDAMMYFEATEHFVESSDTFHSRTLMTGSDIVALDHALIDNFAKLTLELPDAIS